MNRITLRHSVLIVVLLSIAMLRLIPHYPNFTPLGAMALFGGAYFSKKWHAFLITLGALFVSDLAINLIIYNKLVLLHPMWLGVYGSFGLIILLGGVLLKKVTIAKVLLSSISASILFFLISNFGVWIVDPINLYSNTATGLFACYVAGLPYSLGTIFGDLFYSAILFTIFEYAQSRFLILKPIKG